MLSEWIAAIEKSKHGLPTVIEMKVLDSAFVLMGWWSGRAIGPLRVQGLDGVGVITVGNLWKGGKDVTCATPAELTAVIDNCT
jgi:hypothetical protein